MSNPYEPSSDPWSDPARATAPPAPPRDALAGTPVPDSQAPPPSQYQAPQYPAPPTYPAPPQYPAPQYPPPPYPAAQYPAPPQPSGPQYPPPQHPGTPPYPGQPGYPYGYQGWPPPAPPKPKSRVGLIIGIVAGAVVLCVAGAITLTALGLNRASQLAGPSHVVVEVTGSGPTLITFSVVGPEPYSETGTHPVPYTITRDVPRDSSSVTVKVQTISPGGDASCRIVVNGTRMASRTATGFNAQAICQTTV